MPSWRSSSLGAAGEASPQATSPPAPTSETTPATTSGDACPNHVPGVHTGAVDDPYGPGDEIALGCYIVIVDQVVPNATDAVIAANPGASPAEGNTFMTATLTITRASDGPGDVDEVEVVAAGSMTTSGEPEDDLVVDPPRPTGELAEGESVTGTYVFEVSGGASISIELSIGSMTPVNVLPY